MTKGWGVLIKKMDFNIPKEKQEIFIKTSIWNSMIEVFLSEKNIDIKKYLVSIHIRWESILIKTWNPLINSEALLLTDKISDNFLNKISKLWIKLENIEIKYI